MAQAHQVILELIEGGRWVVKEHNLDASLEAQTDDATGLPTIVVRTPDPPAETSEVTRAQDTAAEFYRSQCISGEGSSAANGALQATGSVRPQSMPADQSTDIAKLVRETDLSTFLQAASCSQLKAVQELVTERQAERKKLEDCEIQKIQKIFDKKVEGLGKKDVKQACCSWRATKPKQTEEDIRKNIVGNAVLPQPYEEIRTLLEIEKAPIYAKALEEWDRKEALLTSRVERKKKKEANLKNEIYQLIGFFSVFQGVVLTAVSQSNLLHCNNRWSPISLSVVASVVSVAGVIQKLTQIYSLQKTIHSETESLKLVVNRSSTLRREGLPDPDFKKGFNFAKFHGKRERRQSKLRQWTYFTLVIGSLIGFAVGFPVSHWRILCHPGADPYATSGPSSN